MRIYGEARTLKHLIFQQRNTPPSTFCSTSHASQTKIFEEMKKRNADKIKITLDQKVIKCYDGLNKNFDFYCGYLYLYLK